LIRIGIDLGGTKIAGVALTTDDEIVAQSRVATPRDDYEGTLAAIVTMVADLASGSGASEFSTGIGMPGSVSPLTGKVQNANSTWLNGQLFQRDLEQELGQPVRLANDANCLALSEAHDGAAKDTHSVFGVILGTGCGGGLAIGGKAMLGKHSICGEWGHNPLPWPNDSEHPGPDCWCSRQGCLETWISGPGLAADHARKTGQHITSEQIAGSALQGDADCLDSLDRHLDRCGRGLAHVVNIVDPEMIVIGGGLVDLPGLVSRLPGAIAHHVFAGKVDITVQAAHHGPASGVRGAARLWALDELDGAVK
jgi:fructokinase